MTPIKFVITKPNGEKETKTYLPEWLKAWDDLVKQLTEQGLVKEGE